MCQCMCICLYVCLCASRCCYLRAAFPQGILYRCFHFEQLQTPAAPSYVSLIPRLPLSRLLLRKQCPPASRHAGFVNGRRGPGRAAAARVMSSELDNIQIDPFGGARGAAGTPPRKSIAFAARTEEELLHSGILIGSGLSDVGIFFSILLIMGIAIV